MSNYIGNQPSAGEFKKLDSIASSFNGSLTQFDLDYSTVNQSVGDATQLIVSLNGIIQEPGTAYTLGIGGGSIVFASAPASTDTCHIVLLGGVGGTTTPTDGSVTASKLDSSLKDYLEETFTANGSQTVFTLTRTVVGANTLLVTIDGIVQPSSAFTASGTTLTISEVLAANTNVRVVHMGVKAGIYVPANDSVTTDMLANSINTDIASKLPLAGGTMTGGLTVQLSTGQLRLQGTSNTNKNVSIFYNESGDYGQINVDESGVNQKDLWVTGLNLKFGRSTSSESMRIDSSGNLLVGTTDSDPNNNSTNTSADDGFAVTNNVLRVAKYNDNSAVFNRTGGDGAILGFRKSGTTIGSIGVTNGTNAIFNSQGGTLKLGTVGTERYNFDLDQIYPTVDNDTNLGATSQRFKDAYLSGGIHLGGTGSANKLSDYEEGTWTPTIVGGGTPGTYEASVSYGTYTKIGRQVNVQFVVTAAASLTGGGSSYLRLIGLPFSYTVGEKEISCAVRSTISFTGNYLMAAHDASSANYSLAFYSYSSSGVQTLEYLSRWGVNKMLKGNITYFTDQ